MRNIKKIAKYTGITLSGFLGVIVLAFILVNIFPQYAEAVLTRLRSGSNVTAMRTASATTTPSEGAPTDFIATGSATTTLTFESDNFEALNVDMIWISTTSVRSQLSMEVLGSDDNIDFYTYDLTAVNGSLTNPFSLTSSSTPYLWIPDTLNGTSSKKVLVPYIHAKFTRLVFSLASTTARTVNDSIGFYANVTGVIRGN